MKLAELCAGYGGLHLSMLAAGWPVELAWYAETDPDAAAVLAAHHPGVPNLGDITTAQFTAVEPVDVIAAGYPCQPFSAAGLRRGMDDERWIWPDIARAVRLVRPRWVLLENVPGHLLRGASRVVADLAGLGYVGSWTCVRASDVGAPHRRERLFIVAADADRDAVRPEPAAVAARQLPAVAGDDRQGPGGLDLLPTPNAALGRGTGFPSPHLAQERYQRGTRCLDDAVALLPTPRATDGTKGGPNQRGSSGDLMLPSAVQLLQTPTTEDAGRSGSPDWAQRWASGEIIPETQQRLRTQVLMAGTQRWGTYAAAITRWETVLGRPAPEPTEPGTRGQARLSARFVEWLMGLPAGWVTDHVGRNPALRILGNGVVPQQGAYALAHLPPVPVCSPPRPGRHRTTAPGRSTPPSSHSTTGR